MKALTALLLSTTLLAAHAETASPSKAILGTWCSVRQDKASHITRYRREVNPPKGEATCKGEDWMTVGPTGYDGGEFACKTIEGEMIFDAEINAITQAMPMSHRDTSQRIGNQEPLSGGWTSAPNGDPITKSAKAAPPKTIVMATNPRPRIRRLRNPRSVSVS